MFDFNGLFMLTVQRLYRNVSRKVPLLDSVVIFFVFIKLKCSKIVIDRVISEQFPCSVLQSCFLLIFSCFLGSHLKTKSIMAPRRVNDT